MDQLTMFQVYYAGLVAMQYHPRNIDNVSRDTLEDMADVAWQMVGITNGYWHTHMNIPPIFKEN